MRGKLIDLLLILIAVVAAIWLAMLVYHNRLGGHVAPPAAVADNAVDPSPPR